jgi:hypothetical protein
MHKRQQVFFLLSVANPALLYQVSKKNLKPRLTYQENNKKVFYDSMKFGITRKE